MGSVLINSIGTSPMVVTEAFRYLRNVDSELKDVWLILTQNSEIVAGANVCMAAILSKYKDVHIHKEILDFEDISNNSDLYKFIDALLKIIKTEREEYHANKTYLNVSGGRKIQTIVTSVFAGLMNIDEIVNVIASNINNINMLYERNKDIVSEFYTLDKGTDGIDLYNKYKEELDPIFYPNPNNLNFIEVPVINIPRDEILVIKKLLEGYFLSTGDIPDYKINNYIKSNLIIKDRTKTYPTDLGTIVYNFLK